MDPVACPEITQRLNPALRHLMTARTNLDVASLGLARESLDRRRREIAQALDTRGVEIADAAVVVAGGRRIPIRIYRRPERMNRSAVVIYCHAGAFVLGNLDTDHRQCIELVRNGGCTVVSVDYRLAPEHPYPAAIDDVLAVLDWVADTVELDIDPSRIAIAGSSAGAALAAGVAQRAAAGQAPPVVFQLLHQPVLDDRPTPSKQEFTDTPGFDGPAAALMWRYYLAGQPRCRGAVPAVADTLAGSAPALITCSDLDPLRDEALEYALALMRAGVAVELHLFAGTCHGFDSLMPDWETSRRLFALQGEALQRALHIA